jgi:hypothetical protein
MKFVRIRLLNLTLFHDHVQLLTPNSLQYHHYVYRTNKKYSKKYQMNKKNIASAMLNLFSASIFNVVQKL